MPKLYAILFLFLAISCKRQQEPFYYYSEEEFIANNEGLSDSALLGKLIFFDPRFSEPEGTSCASCHSPMASFSDLRHLSFSPGSTHGSKGKRNAMSISYNAFAPHRHAVELRGRLEETGGFFWDGRAEFMEAQALSPLVNENEMNNRSLRRVVEKLYKADYYPLFEKLYGKMAMRDSQNILLRMTFSIKAFQQSFQVNPFTSKFDFYLQQKAELSEQELRGLKLFSDEKKSKCSLCHSMEKEESSGRILFTDFSYDNIGLPKHPEQANEPLDIGIAGAEHFDSLEIGKFKAPSLRNVAITFPYMHNGIFSTLEEVMEFYNERDVNPKFKPEYRKTMNTEELGDLKLSKEEIQDIIAFLHTLTDGYRLKD